MRTTYADALRRGLLICHGLNGVYIKDRKKWIRLDARGNKADVNAQFSLETERLAFAVRPELGEEDGFVIYPSPDVKVVEKLRNAKTRTKLWENLPNAKNMHSVQYASLLLPPEKIE
ncbi:MAG: hypothetical protein K2J14_00100, partial [Treponemataceae bacterium]|nr:hypothetical protein [Treponemataceae bacterium]